MSCPECGGELEHHEHNYYGNRWSIQPSESQEWFECPNGHRFSPDELAVV